MAHGGLHSYWQGWSSHRSNAGSAGGPSLGAPVAALAFANVAALAHPNPLVIAMLSAILVVAGFALAVVIRFRRGRDRSAERMLWPALMVFFGFVGTIFSDLERILQSF